MTLSAARPEFDSLMQNITGGVLGLGPTQSAKAVETARYCWMDTIGCGLDALRCPACTKLLGPFVPHANLANGARVPGTC